MLRVMGWKEICHVNTNGKKGTVAILISNRVNFRARKAIRDKEGQYRMMRKSVFQKITIVNVYVPNNTLSKYVRQQLIEPQEEVYVSTIVGET